VRSLYPPLGSSLLLPLVFILAACGTPRADAGNPPTPAAAVQLEEVMTGLEQPTTVTNAGDSSDRLFITQKTGLARVIEAGELLSEPFLDLTESVSTDSERGLLGLAFHPQYAENGRLFVNYTDLQGSTVVAEYSVSDDPNVVDAASERVILTIEQPFSNHNGGNLAFGPDGFLYIGTGDGGAGGDPEGNGQDLGALLGKMLRIDIDQGDPYAVPEDNPFVGEEGVQPEIWAYGLRNPWKYAFDRETGDLWIADVGQGAFEEVNVQPAASEGGENYGWNTMEGSSCYSEESTVDTCDESGLTLPVAEYGRDEGNSITGGYVYRGAALPSLNGHYIFGDFGSGTVWSVSPTENHARTVLLESGLQVVAFGEDEAGELYLADFSGTLYRFAGE
jgi:glucose/arabinose dehydrogenase